MPQAVKIAVGINASHFIFPAVENCLGIIAAGRLAKTFDDDTVFQPDSNHLDEMLLGAWMRQGAYPYPESTVIEPFHCGEMLLGAVVSALRLHKYHLGTAAFGNYPRILHLVDNIATSGTQIKFDIHSLLSYAQKGVSTNVSANSEPSKLTLRSS